MTTEQPGARGTLQQLNIRTVPQWRKTVLFEQLKRELRKCPVIIYRLGQSLREYAKLPKKERAGLYREELYNRMTLQQYDLFKDIVAWMRLHPADVGPLSNCLFNFKSEENYRIMDFILKHPACLPEDVEKATKTVKGLKHPYYADKCPRALHRYDLCIEELRQRQKKEKRDELTPPEVTAADSSSREPAATPKKARSFRICRAPARPAAEEWKSGSQLDIRPYEVTADDVIRRETNIWNLASISQRTEFFEEKNRILQVRQ